MGNQPALLGKFEEELDNIRVAWRHLLENQRFDEALKMVFGLHTLYELRGWYLAAVSLFDQALEALDEGSNVSASNLKALAGGAKAYSLALLGQPEAERTTEYVDVLRASGEAIPLWHGLQNLAINLSYLGRHDEMCEAADEMIVCGEKLENPFWVAGGQNWRSLPSLLLGDLDTANRLLPEAMKAFEDIDEHYFMTWTLYLQAMIATSEQRPQDAIELYARQVSRGREIGYRRGTMVALEGLGKANLAAGELEASEIAFIESLAAAEEMGMVADMLGVIAKVAKVRALMSRKAEAVELLATVLAEPMRSQNTMSDMITIEEMATASLDELRAELDPDEFSDAHLRGTSKPYDVATKELLETLKR